MKKYLVVKCEPLSDQYECDADRTPLFITDDWKNNAPGCKFEVYEISENGNVGECIKNYDTPTSDEKGMVLGYWKAPDMEEFVIVKKWPGRTVYEGIPNGIKEDMEEFDDYDYNDWLNWHYLNSFDDDDNCWMYGEYKDGIWPSID